MNLQQAKKLTVGDKFRRPSTNPHDNGWRLYEVYQVERSTAGIVVYVRDHHGYAQCMGLRPYLWKWGNREWFATAELCQ